MSSRARFVLGTLLATVLYIVGRVLLFAFLARVIPIDWWRALFQAEGTALFARSIILVALSSATIAFAVACLLVRIVNERTFTAACMVGIFSLAFGLLTLPLLPAPLYGRWLLQASIGHLVAAAAVPLAMWLLQTWIPAHKPQTPTEESS